MLIAGILALAVASLALMTAVAWPVLADRPPDADARADAEARRQRDLDEDLAHALEVVHEIDLDHRAGNLSDADFAELDAAARAQAVAIMRRRTQEDGTA